MKKVFIYAFAGVLLLCGCNGTIEKKEAGERPKSKSYKLVVENIDSMGMKPWDKSVYLNIKDNQINKLKHETERVSASEHLQATYGKLLVKEAKSTLEDGCEKTNAHTHLSKLFTELKGFTKTPGYSGVTTMKKAHDEAANFANSGVGSQRVSSYRDSYDTSYESTHISKARQYLSDSSVKCKITREKLESLTRSSAYEGRRRRYCEAIVNAYLQCTDPARSELNAALGHLHVYNGSSSLKSGWKDAMRDHYESLQPVK